MGCDIHMYVEYKSKESKRDYWNGFGGRINPGRNYWMFGLISKGVRRYENDDSIEAKGIPENLSWETQSDATLYISEDYPDEERNCSLENAKKWEGQGCKITYRDGKPVYVEHPDHHSHTWLNVEEFKKVLELFNNEKDSTPNPEYEALLASMQKLSEYDNEVRVVVWFDN